MEHLLNWNLLSTRISFTCFLLCGEIFLLLGNAQLTGSHVFNEMLSWLKMNKLFCYVPLISIVLSILHDILSLDGAKIASHKYRYFHLRFLPSPWKSGLCLAAVMKRRGSETLAEALLHRSNQFTSVQIPRTEWLLHPARDRWPQKINPCSAQTLQGALCLWSYPETVGHGHQNTGIDHL